MEAVDAAEAHFGREDTNLVSSRGFHSAGAN